jgi:hypothetical protein
MQAATAVSKAHLKENPMRTVAQQSPLKWSASLGLLVLAAWTSLPAHAADQRVASLSRPCVTAHGVVCASDVAAVSLTSVVTPAKAAKPPAAATMQPAAKASRQDNFERDLWRHQGVG